MDGQQFLFYWIVASSDYSTSNTSQASCGDTSSSAKLLGVFIDVDVVPSLGNTDKRRPRSG